MSTSTPQPEERAARESRVCYIPEQIDKAAFTSPPTARNTPLSLTFRDVWTLISVLPLLPNVFRPVSSRRSSDELSLKGLNPINLVILAVVTCLELLIFTILGLSSYGLKQNCDCLAQIFGRPIIGIHNPTYGLIGDLLECIIQRSLSFNNYSIRFTYDYVKKLLVDPKIDKIVLIGHSQGGIIVSMVLDLLFTDLPAENMAKLEVYTFGSAASYFNNPLRAIDPRSSAPRTGVIPYIEHYVNGEDLVPRWGILYNVRTILENKFAGKIFIRTNITGHMLNQHYLDCMFPVPGDQQEGEQPGFLDQVVEVDETTPHARNRLIHKVLNVPAKASSTEDGRCLSISEDMSGSPIASLRTVRELSRLWRYMGGNDPDSLP
ncbi:predicted protein [Uncinocarpus reesii 1704]|uniref:Uncharacterized protein n=1 Tax=Uncinocarpus reesii (strain UAMH 1704) TaxID=336963 RepID=C4JGU0_UNCRE|nr:uncharacterized protein UREG_02602 [Uncinocarpus reesii 1704]EEP77753.1 predicted protein [Uncinocarpus reesii 1704]